VALIRDGVLNIGRRGEDEESVFAVAARGRGRDGRDTHFARAPTGRFDLGVLGNLKRGLPLGHKDEEGRSAVGHCSR
jgi:hypothetical protein